MVLLFRGVRFWLQKVLTKWIVEKQILKIISQESESTGEGVTNYSFHCRLPGIPGSPLTTRGKKRDKNLVDPQKPLSGFKLLHGLRLTDFTNTSILHISVKCQLPKKIVYFDFKRQLYFLQVWNNMCLHLPLKWVKSWGKLPHNYNTIVW